MYEIPSPCFILYEFYVIFPDVSLGRHSFRGVGGCGWGGWVWVGVRGCGWGGCVWLWEGRWVSGYVAGWMSGRKNWVDERMGPFPELNNVNKLNPEASLIIKILKSLYSREL